MDPVPLTTLLFAMGAGLLAGLLANWAADILPLVAPVAGEQTKSPLPRRQPQPSTALARLPLRSLRERSVVMTLVVLFSLLAYQNPADPARVFVSWCYAWFLTTVLVIDLETRRVLNIMLLPAAVFAVAAGLWLGQPSLPSMLAGAVVAFGLFWCLFLLGRVLYGRGALGFGDVKLVAIMGLMTGYPNVLHGLGIGAALGGIGAFVLLITRRAGWKTTCAYAPYLAAGAMLALWGTFG
jgi:leader peptidase (prepilin peptidase)/N-methyltransferase